MGCTGWGVVVEDGSWWMVDGGWRSEGERQKGVVCDGWSEKEEERKRGRGRERDGAKEERRNSASHC